MRMCPKAERVKPIEGTVVREAGKKEDVSCVLGGTKVIITDKEKFSGSRTSQKADALTVQM